MRAPALSAVLLVLVLTGCSGGGGAPTPSASPTPVPTGPGPLEAFLGYGGFESRSAGEVAAEIAARENTVAACMADLGFAYVPVTLDTSTFRYGDDGPLRGTREFAELYGYGVWDSPEVEPGQFTFELDESENHAYRDSLSPAAQELWDEALYGSITVDGNQTTSDGSGCADLPQVRTGDDVEYLRGVEQEARDFLDSLDAAADPRLAEVDTAWASCMADQGYEDATPTAAMIRVADEMAAIAADASDEARAEHVAAERRLAIADVECQQTTGWADRRRAVEHELQQEYVDSRRAELDALAEARAIS